MTEHQRTQALLVRLRAALVALEQVLEEFASLRARIEAWR